MTTALTRLLANGDGRARRQPLPSVVSSPKTSAAYQLHSYPTKIPPEAITPFIEASTAPGGVVLDPFCGSGMAGLAAQSCGRSAILSDLSPGAVHLARNHNRVASAAELLNALARLDQLWMRRAESALYATECPTCWGPALMRHTIWSDVHACNGCGQEVVLWDEADPETGSVPRSLYCVGCGEAIRRAGAVPERSEPAFKVVHCRGGCCHLQEGPTTPEDVAHLQQLATRRLRQWFPSTPIDTSREMYKRSALHLRGIQDVGDFYLPRAKHALSRLWRQIENLPAGAVRDGFRFAFTNTSWHASRMRRYNARGGQRPLTGTLYIPQLTAEANAFEVFRHQVKQLAAFAATREDAVSTPVFVRRSSATDLSWLPDQSVDYVFTDPPFGSNIFYGDCNLVWESWLGQITDVEQEIVVNRSRTIDEGGKGVDDYENLLADAFSEMRRVLRANGRASVVFHNSDDKVWTALLRAAERGGLQQSDVSILDKVQRSMKGYRGRNGSELVPFYDLVITFAPGRVTRPRLNGAGEIAVDAVRQHLSNLVDYSPESHERSLEYLYSLAVSEVLARGAEPDGLSFRAFEKLCGETFARQGRHFSVS